MNNDLIVLGGVGRSGTSILGKLVGSLDNVEFFYEPKTIDLLFSKIDEIDKESWKALFKRNIYDDLLINSLAGRYINTNRHDISSVYNYMDPQEVALRLSRSYTQDELDKLAGNRVIAFKLLDSIFYTDKVQQHFPKLQPLFIIREPVSTLNSLYKKHWFSDSAISANSPEPSSIHKIYKNHRMPGFLEAEDYERWLSLSELERYGYYYICLLERMCMYLDKDSLFIDYDSLLSEREIVLERILRQFNLKAGAKTAQILASIKIQESRRDLEILTRLPEAMQANIKGLYQTLKGRADKQLAI